MTILLLKAYYFDGEAYELKNVLRELIAVLPTLSKLDSEDWIKVQESVLELRNVNRELWHLEEDIRLAVRGIEVSGQKSVEELVKEIHSKNYERADIKRWINDEMDPEFAEMKNYESTTDNKPKSSSG